MNALDSVNAMFDTMFPKPTAADRREADAIDRRLAATDKFDNHVAKRAPEIAREYAKDPARQIAALAWLNFAEIRHLGQLLATGDDVEAMARIRARITARLADLAEEAAQDEAYALFPEAI